MSLQDIYFLTMSISAIISSIFFISFVVILIFLSLKLEKILNQIELIIWRGINISETAGLFVSNLIDRIKDWSRFRSL